jgi:phenylpyruvate tautomerase PptA (4-oxalocrotonate tautomerase family)
VAVSECLLVPQRIRGENNASCHREALAREIGTAEGSIRVLNYGEESVSLAIEEVKPQDWAEKVYKPDIQETGIHDVASRRRST